MSARLKSMGLEVRGEELWALDQRQLPREERWLRVESPERMVELICALAVRGAPLIGVAAALALGGHSRKRVSRAQLCEAAQALRSARPTAVNLMWAMDRMLACEGDLWAEACRIFSEDAALCESLANRGAPLIPDGAGVLTHCNAGALATAGIGTAVGVIRRAWENGKRIHVFVDETRPLLQGARLTAWELGKLGIPHTLICDNMAGALMRSGRVHCVFTGADRVAANGDAANKIGTYGVAVLARHHGIPFYIVAPSTSFDPGCRTGAEIPIEEREADEVRGGAAPDGSPVWNPAFDVTPRELIRGIIFEDRIW